MVERNYALGPHKSGLLADFCALGIDYGKKKIQFGHGIYYRVKHNFQGTSLCLVSIMLDTVR